MTLNIKISLIICIFQIVVSSLNATEQYGDKLVVNGDTTWIEATPLEDYLEEKDSRLFGDIILDGQCTALWRGYVATWKLENDSLFLIGMQLDYCSDAPKSYNIKNEFKTDKVFAYWVNRTIRKPEGLFIQHGYYYDPIHEGEILYSFEEGQLKRKNTYSFINKKKDYVFPGERFLEDTIRNMILSEIPIADRNLFNVEETTEIAVNFNRKGEIRKINIISNDKIYSKDEVLILKLARQVLNDFPRIMPVYHTRYEPQFVRININGYCIKNDLYENDGCDRY